MLKISRKIEYSLMTLRHMVGKVPGTLTTAKEVCDTYKLPFDMVSKVMQGLAQGGLLRSEQGAHGGYLVVRDLKKVSFLDLVEVVEGRMGIVKCLNAGTPTCDLTPTCNIISPISRLNRRINDFYRDVSVLELVQ